MAQGDYNVQNKTIYLPVYLAVIFHFFGYLGMKSAYREWFIATTPFTLLLMAAFIILTWKARARTFWLFGLLCYSTGYAVEWIGVNTGFLFGDYSYGEAMGWKVGGVPLIIGVQWFVTIWSIGHASIWLTEKTGYKTENIFPQKILIIFFAALMTTGFDFILEPAAISLGYWQWHANNQVPFYNYVCWFIVSALLYIPFVLKKELHANPHPFAIALSLIQLLFFIFTA